ncbi:hypothetical protein GGP45_001210 [Salinibacter ruber]|uniref:Uncharacterized protein n=1 Tax=Salinibacter ruber TaxID=146919 RepID=A0A9X3A7P0_9BACT|nr:hypothetical protein [Salinibacter ruber]
MGTNKKIGTNKKGGPSNGTTYGRTPNNEVLVLISYC